MARLRAGDTGGDTSDDELEDSTSGSDTSTDTNDDTTTSTTSGTSVTEKADQIQETGDRDTDPVSSPGTGSSTSESDSSAETSVTEKADQIQETGDRDTDPVSSPGTESTNTSQNTDTLSPTRNTSAAQKADQIQETGNNAVRPSPSPNAEQPARGGSSPPEPTPPEPRQPARGLDQSSGDGYGSGGAGSTQLYDTEAPDTPEPTPAVTSSARTYTPSDLTDQEFTAEQGIETGDSRLAERAQELENEVLSRRNLDPEDVAIHREGDRLTAELTKAGAATVLERQLESQPEYTEEMVSVEDGTITIGPVESATTVVEAADERAGEINRQRSSQREALADSLNIEAAASEKIDESVATANRNLAGKRRAAEARANQEQFGDIDWSMGLGGPEDEVERAVDSAAERYYEISGNAVDKVLGEPGTESNSAGDIILTAAGYDQAGEQYENALNSVVRYGWRGAAQAGNLPAVAGGVMEGVEFGKYWADKTTSGEGGDAAGKTYAAAGTAVSRAAESPWQTGGLLLGSFAGTSAVMGGAARVSSRAGTASRWAIQPGEEAAGTIGHATTRLATSRRTADRIFPNKEPLIFSEEAALRAAGSVSSRARRGLGRVSVDRPSTPIQASIVPGRSGSPLEVNVNTNVKQRLARRGAIEEANVRTGLRESASRVRNAPSEVAAATDDAIRSARSRVGNVKSRIENTEFAADETTRGPALASLAPDRPSVSVTGRASDLADEAVGRLNYLNVRGAYEAGNIRERAANLPAEVGQEVRRVRREASRSSPVAETSFLIGQRIPGRADLPSGTMPSLSTPTLGIGSRASDLADEAVGRLNYLNVRGAYEAGNIRERAANLPAEVGQEFRRVRRETSRTSPLAETAFLADQQLAAASSRLSGLTDRTLRIDIGKPGRAYELDTGQSPDIGVESEVETDLTSIEGEGDAEVQVSAESDVDVRSGDQIGLMRTRSEAEADVETTGVGVEMTRADVDRGPARVQPIMEQTDTTVGTGEQITETPTSDALTPEQAFEAVEPEVQVSDEVTAVDSIQPVDVEQEQTGEVSQELETASPQRLAMAQEMEMAFEAELAFETESRVETERRGEGSRDQTGSTSRGYEAESDSATNDDMLASGWLAEYQTALALGGGPRKAPSQETLAEQDETAQLTEELPTAAMLSDDAETQERLEEAGDLLTFGGSEADNADGGWFL